MSLIAALALALAAPQKAQPSLSSDEIKRLSDAMTEKCAEGDVAGVTCMIGTTKGVVYFNTFGKRNLEKNLPMAKDSIFRLYSMRKPIVAATAMALWEEGRFKLDDPISKYLPEWKNMKVKAGDDVVDAESEVTIRQLMTHSSGMSNQPAGPNLMAPSREYAEALAARPLEFQPGTKFLYSRSIDTVARLVEVITKKPFEFSMRRLILEPCNMIETDFIVPEQKLDRVAMTYAKTDEGFEIVNGLASLTEKPVNTAAGGLTATTQDYANFCQMLLDGGAFKGRRILKETTVDLMFDNHLSEIGEEYGLGGRGTGDGLYFWGGWSGTRFRIDRKTGFYVVVMLQRLRYESRTADLFWEMASEAMKS